MYADGPKRAVEADRYDHSFHSGTDLSALYVYFVHIVDLVGLELEPSGQERLDVKGVLGVRVGSVWVIGVLGDVVLVREERPYTTQLENALSAVHDSQFILAHKLFAELLVVERVGGFPPTILAGVVGVDGLLAQHGGQLLEGSRLLAAQEDGGIHVADDGIGVVLVDGLELGLCLQHQAGRDLAAADGGDQLFQPGNLADVGALVNETPHMDRQPPAVHIVRFFTEQVEQLGVAHGDQEVKAIVRVAHNEKQCSPAISQCIQFQLIVGSDLPQLGNVKYSKARTAGNQDTLGGLTRDEKSRTFSSNSKRSHILRTSSRSIRLILSSIVSLAVSLKWTRTI